MSSASARGWKKSHSSLGGRTQHTATRAPGDRCHHTKGHQQSPQRGDADPEMAPAGRFPCRPARAPLPSHSAALEDGLGSKVTARGISQHLFVPLHFFHTQSALLPLFTPGLSFDSLCSVQELCSETPSSWVLPPAQQQSSRPPRVQPDTDMTSRCSFSTQGIASPP